MNVTLFRDFVEDSRISMDVYADCLEEALSSEGEIQVQRFVPAATKYLGDSIEGSSLRMRASRYLSYPIQASNARSDVFHIIEHGYAHLAAVLDPSRTVVTVHDLIPLLSWKGLVPGMRRGHRPRLGEFSLRWLRRARYVIAISESTRRDVIEHCGCQKDRVLTSHYGLNPSFRQLSTMTRSECRRSLGLPDERQLLVLIAGHQEYKNHRGAVAVFDRVRRRLGRSVSLVRVGRVTADWQALVKAADIGDYVVNVEFVKHSEMVKLYNGVDCLLFPSFYEGFGWPPLEAMACGVPVVTSNAASIPEVVGDAALMGDPEDYDRLAEYVIAMLTDPVRRTEIIYRGMKRAGEFTWQKHVSRIMPLYRDIVKWS